MKTFILTIYFISRLIQAYGQEKDSSLYFFYIKQDNIDTVVYQKEFYKNGNIKNEGWKITEKPLDKSKLTSEVIPPYGIDFGFGVWKTYYKGGQVSSIDSNGVNDTAVKRQYFYNKNGSLNRIVIIKLLAVPYTTNSHGFFSPVADYEWMRKFVYKDGELYADIYFVYKEKRAGTWKYYKKGQLVKTEEYDELGRCLKTIKYGT